MWNHNQQLILAVAMIVGTLLASTVCGEGGCLPPTPGPCAADGVCRPSGGWGYNLTRWRPWPGEVAPRQPTSAEARTVEPDLQMPPLELPNATGEYLRGPARTKKKKSDTPDEQPARSEVPGVLIPRGPGQGLEIPEESAEPLEEDLPEADDDDDFPFNLQGNVPISPLHQDAPPTLPSSLRETFKMPQAAENGFSQSASFPDPVAMATDRPRRSSIALPQRQATAAAVVRADPVVRTSWQQPQKAQLVNPAAVIVENTHRESPHASDFSTER